MQIFAIKNLSVDFVAEILNVKHTSMVIKKNVKNFHNQLRESFIC